MKFIQYILVSIGISLYAQDPNNLLTNNFNPSLLSNFDTTLFYSSLNIIEHEIGLHEKQIGSIFNLNNRTFQSSIIQYGYKSYTETKLTLATTQQISKLFNAGVSINYQHLYIAESPNFKAMSFDIGMGLQKEEFECYLFLENPLNASYLENDIESKITISPVYYWNENLKSQLNVHQSLHVGLSLSHRLSYKYQNLAQLDIIQGIKPFTYGFNLGFRKDKLQLLSQYYKSTYTKTASILIIYTVGNE